MLRKSNPPTPLTIARISAGLRQIDLAATIGKSNAFISRLENGSGAVLTPEIAEKIASAVGTPSFAIFKGMRVKQR